MGGFPRGGVVAFPISNDDGTTTSAITANPFLADVITALTNLGLTA